MKTISRKFLSIITCISMILISSLTLTTAHAYDGQSIESRAIEETFIIQADKVLNHKHGYVTCIVWITYNSVGNTYTVSNVDLSPHFANSWRGLSIPQYSVNPKVGNKVTGDYVTVSFTVFSKVSLSSWDYSCKIYL